MWFTENPWPPILILAVAALGLFFVWTNTRKGMYLAAAITMIVAQVAVYFVERSIVTRAEEIEAAVGELAEAVVAGDVERTLQYISKRRPALRSVVTMALQGYDVQDDLRITDVQVDTFAADSQGHSHFRANGTVAFRGGGIVQRGTTRWRLTWRWEEGRWRIIRIERLHPISGEEIRLLDSF